MADHLRIKPEGNVRILTLNRPDRRNALTLDLIRDLRVAVDDAISDPTAGSLVITGTPPAFSAGMDLSEAIHAQNDRQFAEKCANALFDLFESIYHAKKPIIAAINGHAVAGGAGLMSVCDIAIVARSAKLGYPEILRGLVAAVLMPHLVRHVGERMAKYLLLTGELIEADRAEVIGLASEVVDDGETLTHAIELAHQLADLPTNIYADTKQFLHDAITLPADATADRRRQLGTAFNASPDAAGTINKFLK